jgi:hypothetical protein
MVKDGTAFGLNGIDPDTTGPGSRAAMAPFFLDPCRRRNSIAALL